MNKQKNDGNKIKLGIFVSQQKRFEADDVMRSMAFKVGRVVNGASKIQSHVYLVSPDKDILQAVTEEVTVYIPKIGNAPERLIGPKEIPKIKSGLRAAQFLDLQILLGDAIDDIPRDLSNVSQVWKLVVSGVHYL